MTSNSLGGAALFVWETVGFPINVPKALRPSFSGVR
jgi:hypothetical protein